MRAANRQIPLLNRLRSSIASSRPGAWVFSRTMHYLDRPLLRLTRGRLSMASGFPVVLLTTTGAKTGRPRTVPLLYVELPGGVAVIGSRFGRTKHPGWYHNLRAGPRATIEIQGERREVIAREASDDERTLVWSRAVEMYPGYERYAARANRRIPVMVLTPRA